ncbi:MAG: ribonuclease P protein component [Candidatus Paceibacterota bacterium]
MLPKKQRINQSLFKVVLTKGRSIHSPSLSFRYIKDENLKKSRFSTTVSLKVSKKATERNLIKRRANAVLVFLKPLLKPGFLGVFFVKKEANGLDFENLKEEIAFLLKKAEII